MRLQGRVAIVTGSGRGIGRAIAERYAREGAAVTVTARTEHEVYQTAEEIHSAGGRVLAEPADVSRESDVERLVQCTLEVFGRLDILVNNAGISYPVDFIEAPFAEWHRMLEVNLYGAVLCAQAAAKVMVKQGEGGRIINVSSIHAFRAEPNFSHYDVAKAGMDQLTRSLAVDLAPYDILINSIAPGFVATRMSITDGVNELETDWFRDIYVKRRRIPLARAAQAEEIAPLAVFLASDECTYVTGQVIAVDGGLSVTF